MKDTSGLAIVWNNKILLGHPTNSKWTGTYSIPKGMVEKDEDFLDGAIRETFEEIAISIDKNQITSGPYTYVYPSKRKRLTFYIVEIKELSDIGMIDEIVDSTLFKPNNGILEIDWAGFINFNDAKKKSSNPMQKMLEIVNSIYYKR
ncbi:NUDIX hydrolase [bacterium]|jgi:8-oxo-dGTP pyrophosphatase MutT (NUDIX family)|nr:NUDIX hydrolase [bacterium]